MATEFPISHPWPYKPPSSIQLDYSSPLMDSLFFLADGRAGAHTLLRDFSENSNHATLGGSYTRNPDGSVNYNGASARAVLDSSAAGTFNFLHSNNTQATVSAWMKLDALNPNALGIYLTTIDGGSNRGIRLSLDDRNPSRNNVLICLISNGSSTMTATSSDDAFPQNLEWHHVCVVIDTTVASSAQCMEIFVNGVSIATGNKTITPSNSNHGQDLHIGNRPSLDFEFPGCIDNVEIYQTALSAQEVLWLSKNRWHAYMPMMGFISSTDSVPGGSSVPWHLLIQGAA